MSQLYKLVKSSSMRARFAANPNKEWSGWVVITQDAQCMLAVPNLEPHKGQFLIQLPLHAVSVALP